jgi:hypothetical protein
MYPIQTFVLFVLLSLASCSLEKEVSRVAVPGTNLTIVLSEDEKGMYRYRVLSHGVPVSDERLLGPHYDSGSHPAPVVSVSQGFVTISWPSTHTTHYVTVDVARRQIVQDSNAADAPPKIRVDDLGGEHAGG